MRKFNINMPNHPGCNQKFEVICKISKKSSDDTNSCCNSDDKSAEGTKGFIKRTVVNMIQTCGCVSSPEDVDKYLMDKGINLEDCCKGSEKIDCCSGIEVTEITDKDENDQCRADPEMKECCTFVINCN